MTLNSLQKINQNHDHVFDKNLFISYVDRYPRISITATDEFVKLTGRSKRDILRQLWQSTPYLGIFIYDVYSKMLASVNIRCLTIKGVESSPTVYSNTYRKQYSSKNRFGF